MQDHWTISSAVVSAAVEVMALHHRKLLCLVSTCLFVPNLLLIPQQILSFTETLFISSAQTLCIQPPSKSAMFPWVNISCFPFGTSRAHRVGQLTQEWEERLLLSGGSQSFAQLSNAWASVRSVSHETLPWEGVLCRAYIPQEQASKLRDALPHVIYAPQIKTQYLEEQHSNNSSSSICREYRLVPQIQGYFRTPRSCTADSNTYSCTLTQQ